MPFTAARNIGRCHTRTVKALRRLALCAALLGPGRPALAAAADQVPPEALDIRGVVSDSLTGERLPAVNISISGTNRGAVTNVYGFYLIAGVPLGEYQLNVSAVGYARKLIRVRVGGSHAVAVNVRLVPRLIETPEVTVETEGPLELGGNGVSIYVMTPEQLEAVPTAAQQDLLRSLQLLPGVTSTSDVSAKFYVRGGAGDQNLVQLDGMTLFNPFHAYGSFSVLDPDLVKSATVYTGAYPAGFGGRLSSVVNVATKDGNLSRLSGNASMNFLSGKLELDGPLPGDNSWLVSARKSLFDRTLHTLIPNAAPTSFSDLFVKGTVGTSTGRFGLRGYLSGDDITPPDPAQPDHSWRNAAFSGVVSGLLTDRIYVDVTASYSAAQIKRLGKPASAVAPASSSISELSLRGEFTVYPEGNWHYYGGFEFDFPTIDNSLPTRAGVIRGFQDSQAQWWVWWRYVGMAGPIGIDAGVHSYTRNLFDMVLGNIPMTPGTLQQFLQPRIALSYGFAGSWLAKLSYGVYTQDMITITNEDDLISLFDAWIYLPDQLRPEEARHYVAGIEGRLTPRLSANLQVYLKDYRAIALYNPDKIFPEDPDYISGTGKSTGAELLARYSSPWLDLYASYALLHARLSTAGLTYTPRYDRTHTIKSMATFHVLEGLDLTFLWEYGTGYPYTQNAGYYYRLFLGDIDRTPVPSGAGESMRVLGAKNAARLPDYHRLDAALTYRFVLSSLRGTAGVSIINLYNARNILYYDRTTGKTDYMVPLFPTASLSVEF